MREDIPWLTRLSGREGRVRSLKSWISWRRALTILNTGYPIWTKNIPGMLRRL